MLTSEYLADGARRGVTEGQHGHCMVTALSAAAGRTAKRAQVILLVVCYTPK